MLPQTSVNVYYVKLKNDGGGHAAQFASRTAISWAR
jgi:hypothetical protein